MRTAMLATALVTTLCSGPAFAGNIVLTGHDDDFHQSPDAAAQVSSAVSFIKNGSALPILTFDAGSQLTSLLGTLGITFTNVNPTAASSVADALFDPTKYSAFAVASEQSCGGCDNSAAAVANIAAHSSAIASFFNAGGGILGLAAATDPSGYAYVPESTTNAGGTPNPSNHFQTTAGAALGIPAVNGDPTHNFFSVPGSGGLAPGFQVVEEERDPNSAGGLTITPLTVAFANGAIVGGGLTGGGGTTGGSGTGGGAGDGTSVPEPATAALLGTALAGLVSLRRRGRI